jgi:hypothetical protein
VCNLEVGVDAPCGSAAVGAAVGAPVALADVALPVTSAVAAARREPQRQVSPHQMERRESLPLLGYRRRPRKGLCPASTAVVRVCRERASKRWSALLTQTKSRIGHNGGMRKRLGEKHWAAFVRYAEAEYKAAFFNALTPASGVLCCEGKLGGNGPLHRGALHESTLREEQAACGNLLVGGMLGQGKRDEASCPQRDEGVCPHGVSIDLRRVSSVECGRALPALHLDHTHDVNRICRVWSDALPAEPRSWDDGVCGPLVAHLLFGTEDHVVAQCSARPLWRRQLLLRCGNVRGVEGQDADTFCHDVANAHYDHALRVKDIAWPGE